MSQQSIGLCLKEAREAMPASLYQASRETKIRADFLEHMERDDFNFVSGGPYIKGLLRSYGKWLRLDEGQLFAQFERTTGSMPELSVTKVVRAPARIPPRKRPHWLMAAFSAGGILVILSLVGVMRPSQDVAAPPKTPTEVKPSEAPPSAGGGADVVAAQAPAAPAAGAPLPTVPGQGVKLTVSVVGDKSWVEAYADLADGAKQLIYKGILSSGAAKTFEAPERLSTLIGNLGAVRFNVNGRDLGVPGRTGQVGNFSFDPSTTALAPH